MTDSDDALTRANAMLKMTIETLKDRDGLALELAKAREAFDTINASRSRWKQRALDAGWRPFSGPDAAWTPTGDGGGPATLDEAVGQALGTASMCWENVAGAGEFDSTAAVEVFHGLMAYLTVWHHRHAGTTHQPTRGGDVETWIVKHRDQYHDTNGKRTGMWYAINGLLDDYREHADTGVPLDRTVAGPHPEEA